MESQDAAYRDAIVDAAVREAERAPNIRGADFRYVTVTAINSDGTVSIGDIRARRLEAYQSPAAGDRVVVAQSGNRNWIALGRLSTGFDTEWTTPSLAAGYTHDGNGNGTLQWRGLMSGGTRCIEFRGGVNVPGSVGTGSSTIFTLPSGYRPSSRRSVPAAKNGETHKIDINTNGTVGLVSGVSSAYTWCALYGIYSLD